MPVDYAGNSLGTARGLNITPSTQTFTDWVGSLDTNDYYKFTLSSRSSFNLSLNGLSADANVQLLNSSGTLIRSSSNTGNTAEAIARPLAAGTYYIRVYRQSGDTNYNLNVSAIADNARNTLSRARNLGTLSTSNTYQDFVGTSDSNDYYRFDLSATTSVNIALNGLSADANVQLIRDTNNNKILDSGELLATSANTATTPEAINLTGLVAGTYYVRVYPGTGASTNYSLNLYDWFDQNIQDAALRSAARSRFADSKLDRNDTIAIFKDAEDGSVVDATELTDLRKLVSNAAYLAMSDDVRVLSNKIANGDVANASYQGTSLGNLYAGSSATQMENLIGKWFLGSDRPIASDGATTYTYRLASGSLFQNGISYQDVSQGAVGDCYFLAGLAATAFRSSSTIQNMFIDNGDNTYTVRFFKSDGTKDYVTVDKYLPTLPDINSNYVDGGNLPFAKIGGRHDSSNTELWVALAEKAYAQLNESGWIGQDNTNSYQGISGGSLVHTFEQITGRNTSYGSPDFTSMVNAFNAGQLVGVSSKGDGQVASNIVPGHQYVLTNYNSSTQKFTLFNPWGINGGTDPSNGQFKPGSVELSWSEITASFAEWEYTTA